MKIEMIWLIVTTMSCASELDGTQAQAVAAPSDVTVTSSVVGQADIAWSALPPASKYYVFEARGDESPAYVATVLNNTAFTASGLDPGALYCFAIQAAFPDGSSSDLSEKVCAQAAASDTGTVYNVPLLMFFASNWSPVSGTQAYVQSNGAGSAYIWIPSQPHKALTSITLAVEAIIDEARFTSDARVWKFFKDSTAAEPIGALLPVPPFSTSWTDATVDVGPAQSNPDFDFAIQLEALSPGFLVKNIRATYTP